jgi:hypothetical protein
MKFIPHNYVLEVALYLTLGFRLDNAAETRCSVSCMGFPRQTHKYFINAGTWMWKEKSEENSEERIHKKVVCMSVLNCVFTKATHWHCSNSF